MTQTIPMPGVPCFAKSVERDRNNGNYGQLQAIFHYDQPSGMMGLQLAFVGVRQRGHIGQSSISLTDFTHVELFHVTELEKLAGDGRGFPSGLFARLQVRETGQSVLGTDAIKLQEMFAEVRRAVSAINEHANRDHLGLSPSGTMELSWHRVMRELVVRHVGNPSYEQRVGYQDLPSMREIAERVQQSEDVSATKDVRWELTLNRIGHSGMLDRIQCSSRSDCDFVVDVVRSLHESGIAHAVPTPK